MSVVAAAIAVIIAIAVAENQQYKDKEPKNAVVTAKDTSVAAAVITKQIHK